MDGLMTFGDALAAVENKIQLAPESSVEPTTVERKRTAVRAVVSIDFHVGQKLRDTRFVDTCERREGIHGGHILVAIPETEHQQKELFAQRWAFGHGELDTTDGVTRIIRDPMIRPTDTIGWLCESGKCKPGRAYRGVFMARHMKGVRGVAIEGYKFKCPECRKAMASAYACVTTPTRNDNHILDAVTGPDKADMRALKLTYGAGDNGDSLMLPRLWAVYDKGTGPEVAWEATEGDDGAHAAIKAGREHKEGPLGSQHSRPFDVLPYHLALPYHLGARPIHHRLACIWLDTKPVAGWADRKALEGGSDGQRRIGWKRSFVPQKYNSQAIHGKVSQT